MQNLGLTLFQRHRNSKYSLNLHSTILHIIQIEDCLFLKDPLILGKEWEFINYERGSICLYKESDSSLFLHLYYIR